jgi:8-oxo-dGTP pyrophosphatase MutT (NUDIX family)
MTNSSWVAEQLAGYQPEQDGLCAYERVTRQLMLHHAATQPRAFWRDCFTPGHFTASMLVTNPTHSKVLLMHHKKLQHWLQFGGHADGEENLLAVAVRELEEESGYGSDAITLQPGVFDLDIQCIPARGAEPEHLHYDMRFLAVVDDTQPVPGSAEQQECRWFGLAEVEAMVPVGQGRWRMMQKLRLLAG